MNSLVSLSEIEKLTAGHRVKGFDCGEKPLDVFLIRYALKNQGMDSSQTYVVHRDEVVVGYYSLSYGGVSPEQCPESVANGMPKYPIGVMIFARFAVCKKFQAKGLGTSLIKDAFRRTIQAAEIAGLRAILVDALNDKAKDWYKKLGFIQCPVGEHKLMMSIQDVRASSK